MIKEENAPVENFRNDYRRLCFCQARTMNVSQDAEQRGERGQGNLRIGDLSPNPRSIALGIHKRSIVALSDVLLHIQLGEASVQRGERPWL